MTDINLKEILIDRIQKTDDPELLNELSILFELHEPEAVYELNDEQRKHIENAREQIMSGKFLTNDDANKDIAEWLEK